LTSTWLRIRRERAAEYLAQFRTDVEAFVLREAVEASIARGVYERDPEGIEATRRMLSS
jgi:hypothetical protein